MDVPIVVISSIFIETIALKKVYLTFLSIGVVAILSATLMSSMRIHGARNINTMAHAALLIAVIMLPFVQEQKTEEGDKPVNRIFNTTTIGSCGAVFIFTGMLMRDFHVHGSSYFKMAGVAIVLVVFIVMGIVRLRKKN